MKNAIEIVVTGDLFNTGFRFYAMKKGIELGLTGTISYYGEYGDVYIHAEGEEDSLKQFTGWCAKGMPYCKVYKVDIKAAPILNCTGLDIVPAGHVHESVEEIEPKAIPKRKSLLYRFFGF